MSLPGKRNSLFSSPLQEEQKKASVWLKVMSNMVDEAGEAAGILIMQSFLVHIKDFRLYLKKQ